MNLMDYIPLLQASAVTAVVCVLLVAAGADLYSIEPTGTVEPAGGPPILAPKYVGRLADSCRLVMFGFSILLAAAYTPLLAALIDTTVFVHGAFGAAALAQHFIPAVSLTIIIVCWVALLATQLRRQKMRAA